MEKIPADIKAFVNSSPWWSTGFPTEVVCSGDGVGDLIKRVQGESRRPFYVLDSSLRDQEAFIPLFGRAPVFIFDASASEPRTVDVDRLVELIGSETDHPDLIVAAGGGSTMDLAKAAAICTANPGPSFKYQGYDMEMKKGLDIWVLPTLNGTGAEITPIAVLRGPEKKLGINNKFVEPAVAFIDPQLSASATKLNRFFTLMDCYYHHYEITKSKTSSGEALADASKGLMLAKDALSQKIDGFDAAKAIKAAMASVLGGSSSIGGRVGAAHALSYGLSNSSPALPHSVAVTISMLAMEEIYPDGYSDTLRFLDLNGIAVPCASDYGISEKDIWKMTKTALGMEKLWQSCFGNNWQEEATPDFVRSAYMKITSI
ncbi:MAG: iron-containing alcohol dehydrogenase [Synergistota bacterium]|nr:iron-containing alcohol dehydrogenase [Synergistota bacterium]